MSIEFSGQMFYFYECFMNKDDIRKLGIQANHRDDKEILKLIA